MAGLHFREMLLGLIVASLLIMFLHEAYPESDPRVSLLGEQRAVAALHELPKQPQPMPASLNIDDAKAADVGAVSLSEGPVGRETAPMLHIGSTTFEARGCYPIPSEGLRQMYHDAGKDDQGMTPTTCAIKCTSLAFAHFEVTGKSQCWCGSNPHPARAVMLPTEQCDLPCSGDKSLVCGGRWRGSVYKITSPVREALTFYLEPAKNRGSLFFSGRLQRWATGRYVLGQYLHRFYCIVLLTAGMLQAKDIRCGVLHDFYGCLAHTPIMNHALCPCRRFVYRTVIINSRLSGNVTEFLRDTCHVNPGPKVFVGHGELLLGNWPGNAVMIIT